MQTEDAMDEVRKLKRPGQYDYYKFQPASYNLSIQYDREMKADAKKAEQVKKKKALMEAAGELEGPDDAAARAASDKIEKDKEELR